MLHEPTRTLRLNKSQITRLLKVAAKSDYSTSKASQYLHELQLIAFSSPPLPKSREGYFIRLSESSPKDVDDGNLQPVHTKTEAFLKTVCSKRAVQALLTLHANDENDAIDNVLYFFPYHTTLDRLSEWRCYIHSNEVVVISQSRFYQAHHPGVEDGSLREMVQQIRALWHEIGPTQGFTECLLDVYAEVHKPDFQVKLIEVNPYGPHCGSESLLFHWVDDAAILLPDAEPTKTILRLVDPESDSTHKLGRKEAYEIGRADIIQDEFNITLNRGLGWILLPHEHRRFMRLKVPGQDFVTRKERLERFRDGYEGSWAERKTQPLYNVPPEDHPRLKKLQKACVEWQDYMTDPEVNYGAGADEVMYHTLYQSLGGFRVAYLRME